MNITCSLLSDRRYDHGLNVRMSDRALSVNPSEFGESYDRAGAKRIFCSSQKGFEQSPMAVLQVNHLRSLFDQLAVDTEVD